MSKHEKTTIEEYIERVRIPVTSAIIGAVCGALSIGIIAYTANGSLQKSREEGRTAGRAEATSNLVANLNAAIYRAESNLYNSAKALADNKDISRERKESYIDACSDYMHQMRFIQEVVNSPFVGTTPRLGNLIPILPSDKSEEIDDYYKPIGEQQ